MIGLQLPVSCNELALIPSRGGTVIIHTCQQQRLRFSLVFFFQFAAWCVELKQAGPQVSCGRFFFVQNFSFELAFLTLGSKTSSWQGSSEASYPLRGQYTMHCLRDYCTEVLQQELIEINEPEEIYYHIEFQD